MMEGENSKLVKIHFAVSALCNCEHILCVIEGEIYEYAHDCVCAARIRSPANEPKVDIMKIVSESASNADLYESGAGLLNPPNSLNEGVDQLQEQLQLPAKKKRKLEEPEDKYRDVLHLQNDDPIFKQMIMELDAIANKQTRFSDPIELDVENAADLQAIEDMYQAIEYRRNWRKVAVVAVFIAVLISTLLLIFLI